MEYVNNLDELMIKPCITFVDLLKFRRSIRDYQDRKVSPGLIKSIIKESTLAPSSGNDQPWKFIIINDKAILKKMSDESKKNVLARIASNPMDYAKRFEKILRVESFNVFFNAPCLILILGFPALKNMYVDCASVANYFMLSAASRGLGTCWVNLGSEIKSPELLSELGIPEDCKIIAPIILGYPARIPRPPKRKKPDIKIIGG